MKAFKYILGLIAVGGLMVSCDTDVENKTVIHPKTYDSQYYENLRNYKKSEHSIMFGYFADYDNPMTSMQIRFMGLPDSLDMISLWGGIPSKENTAVWDELRFVQKVKGTKMLVCAITHIDDQLDDLDFKKAYNEAKAMPAGEERDAALNRAIEMFADYYSKNGVPSTILIRCSSMISMVLMLTTNLMATSLAVAILSISSSIWQNIWDRIQRLQRRSASL